MNANIFISGNTFTNIVDDPFEPEGDSFNLHFFNNTLINTHRMASIVPASTCTGPIFVYGNYQKNTLDPTGEAASGRRNSAIKLDMRGGNCPNGVWIFNNTVDADVTGAHTYQISGVNLGGTEGATCAPVSTSAAVIGWGDAVGPSAPKAPINLKAD